MTEREQREARLAAQLRANLRRRKAHAPPSSAPAATTAPDDEVR